MLAAIIVCQLSAAMQATLDAPSAAARRISKKARWYCLDRSDRHRIQPVKYHKLHLSCGHRDNMDCLCLSLLRLLS